MSARKRIFVGVVAGLVLSGMMPVTTANAVCYVNNDK